MENQQRQQLKKALDLVVFRWRLLAVCLLLGLAGGLTVYLQLPKIYASTALLSFERQQVNPARMAPEKQNSRLQDTVATLTQVVLSRTNLEEVINHFDLYAEERKELPIEDVIEEMREKIAVKTSKEGDTFTVTFEGRDPSIVQKVTNTLASKFIEENLKYREERATETSRYTEDELNMAKAVLDRKEQAMRDYKLKYYNEMPEQRQSNLARLSALHEQYQAVQDSIQDLERTRVMAQEQISLRKRINELQVMDPDMKSHGAVLKNKEPLSPAERLRRLKIYLKEIEGRYTEKHPEVRHTRQLITRLEEEIGKEGSAGEASGATALTALDPEVQQLKLQIKEVDLNIRKLKKEQEKIKAEIARYEKWIEATPVREAEWNALTRDYDELRRHYDYLVAQNLQARSVEHLERKQKGSKFKVVDPARRPEKPVKPDFKKVFALSLALGLGLGIGLALLFSFFDTSFTDPLEVEQALGLRVIATVPLIELEPEQRRKKLGAVVAGLGFAVGYLAFGAALVYFYLQGRIIL